MKKLLIGILVIIEVIVGATAIWGGYGLITTNGLGMPLSYLSHSPFQSFLIPGIILLCVVGGSNLLAAIMQLQKNVYAKEASAIAAFGLLIWVVVELYIIAVPHILQLIYFALSVVSLVIIMVLLKSERGKNL